MGALCKPVRIRPRRKRKERGKKAIFLFCFFFSNPKMSLRAWRDVSPRARKKKSAVKVIESGKQNNNLVVYPVFLSVIKENVRFSLGLRPRSCQGRHVSRAVERACYFVVNRTITRCDALCVHMPEGVGVCVGALCLLATVQVPSSLARLVARCLWPAESASNRGEVNLARTHRLL